MVLSKFAVVQLKFAPGSVKVRLHTFKVRLRYGQSSVLIRYWYGTVLYGTLTFCGLPLTLMSVCKCTRERKVVLVRHILHYHGQSVSHMRVRHLRVRVRLQMTGTVHYIC